MKKALIILLALVLVFSFSACANRNNNQGTGTGTEQGTGTGTDQGTGTGTGTDQGTGTGTGQGTGTGTGTDQGTGTGTGTPTFKDGTYEAFGDKWQYGNENATVVISGGKITEVTLRRLTTEDKEVNYTEWTGAEVGGQKRPNLKQFREDMAKEIIAKQSTDVSEIAGATVSVKNWKIAVQRALEKAEQK